MNTRAFRSRKLGRLVLVRALRDGDVTTVAAVFDRLGPESRARRFHGAKPRLSDADRTRLAGVDADRHVLVAHVDGDEAPAALARLVRCPDDPRAAEIAFEVADCYQNAGIGTALVELLLADARAAGFTRVTADVQLSNRGALALLRRLLGREALHLEGSDIRVDAPLRPLGTAPVLWPTPRRLASGPRVT